MCFYDKRYKILKGSGTGGKPSKAQKSPTEKIQSGKNDLLTIKY
ncbi:MULTISPECIES: hypothetical protein [unclassified Sedimentibacter]|nr:hypothetical protein [Sedimentibacter sp. MB35-C1]WMJ78300.1 hypothetical protein RBQ61_05040 [Sedimentibacter sp. MB35-C1]